MATGLGAAALQRNKTKIKPKPLTAFLILVALFVIGGVVQGVLWDHFDENRTTQVMTVWIIAPTLFFCLMVWWTFFSGFELGTKLAGWGVLLLTGAILWGVFRFQGFDGDFVPRFAYRWDPTAEELFLAAWEAKSNYEGELPVLEDPEKPLEIQPGHWPQFRGPNGDGKIASGNLRRDWGDETPQPVWQQRVGPAWSSFAIVDGLLFTQMQIADDECVVCYEMETGQQVWVHKDEGVRFHEERAGTGPMGTPLFYRGRLYTLGATGVLNCLNPKTGEAYWSTDILKDAKTVNLVWGMAGSPVAHKDLILVNPGSDDEDQTAVAAYDWETGKKIWSGGHHQASYSTPMVATLDGVEQLLVFDGLGLGGHSLKDGHPLWHFPWTNGFKINVAKPI
ncbi:MAG: PQQ-binding-like beta-propeller repeat protein, partial [Planctomycetaceae bacterium]|nr:PQQ-binding-like beta-propeller repeat protein [Planctomycetaceae bacterium]